MSIAPAAAGWRFRQPSVIPGFGLTLGFSLAYLTLIILIPLTGAGLALGRAWLGGFLRHRHRPAHAEGAGDLVRHRRLIAALVNVVFGTIVAWVLVRYRFPGRRIVDAMVDLPFALPTAVAGIALTALYAPKGWIGQPARAARHQGRLHAARHRHRADLHRPALRRAHGAAGHGGDRPARSRKPPRRSAPAASRPSPA